MHLIYGAPRLTTPKCVCWHAARATPARPLLTRAWPDCFITRNIHLTYVVYITALFADPNFCHMPQAVLAV